MQQAALFHRERQSGVVNAVLWVFVACCFGVRLRLSAGSARDIGVSFCAI